MADLRGLTELMGSFDMGDVRLLSEDIAKSGAGWTERPVFLVGDASAAWERAGCVLGKRRRTGGGRRGVSGKARGMAESR